MLKPESLSKKRNLGVTKKIEKERKINRKFYRTFSDNSKTMKSRDIHSWKNLEERLENNIKLLFMSWNHVDLQSIKYFS